MHPEDAISFYASANPDSRIEILRFCQLGLFVLQNNTLCIAKQYIISTMKMNPSGRRHHGKQEKRMGLSTIRA